MIEIKNLSRTYGTLKAVDGLSLTISDGLIYGFLGVNGAGKSTTLGMISGCLAPSDGSVVINGFDILKNPVEAKRQIGYLPELPPLYAEMTPREYLTFIARARGIAKREISSEIEDVMRKTGIYDVRMRVIRQLSKGYRQRIGIAQAIVGAPPVIILDEPTVGLDPEQVVEIRELIRSLRGEHTVIFSSHILSEVSLLCDRVFIIDHGRLICEDTPENLESMISSAQELEISLLSNLDKAAAAIRALGCIENVMADGQKLLVRGKSGAEIREAVALALGEAGAAVTDMHTVSATLEDAFIALTRGANKEDDE